MSVMSMMQKPPLEKIAAILGQQGLALAPQADPAILAGDGSDRGFIRLLLADGRPVVVALPSPSNPKALAEARASIWIGRHLAGCGVPVPAIYAADEEDGVIVFEDAGDLHLATWVSRQDDDEAVARLYETVIAVLVQMQTEAAHGFQPGWCWDSPCYDRQVMLERESGYFLEAFGRGLLGFDGFPPALGKELELVADRASAAAAGFFLHRDFQSRNIMVQSDGSIRIIDFQGGRFGPLGYDLASLLLDPYASLPGYLRQRLFSCYLDRLAERMPLDREQFAEQYWYLAMQRNMQIIGAFAFLSRVRKKTFFARFISPALDSLSHLLADARVRELPALAGCVASMRERLQNRQTYSTQDTLS